MPRPGKRIGRRAICDDCGRYISDSQERMFGEFEVCRERGCSRGPVGSHEHLVAVVHACHRAA